jgi:hypothetical protein
VARTTANMREPDLTSRPPYPERSKACSFCIERTTTGVRHDHCPGESHTTQPGRKDDKVWTCACWKEGHPI